MQDTQNEADFFKSACAYILSAAEVVASVRAYRDCLRSCEKVTGSDPYGTIEVLRDQFIEAIDDMTSIANPNRDTLFSFPLDGIYDQVQSYFTEATYVAAQMIHDHPNCVPKPYATLLGDRRRQHDLRVWAIAGAALGTLEMAGLALNGSKTTGSAVLDAVLVNWAQDVFQSHTKLNNGPIIEVRQPQPLSINLPFGI